MVKTHRQFQRQKKEFSRRLRWTAALLGCGFGCAVLANVLGYVNGFIFWQLIWVFLPLGLFSAASLLVVWLDLRKLKRELLAESSPRGESPQQN